MLLLCALLLGCGDKEGDDTGPAGSDGGAAADGGSADGGGADGGSAGPGYGPDCADSVVVHEPCDCGAVAVNWEEPLAAMQAEKREAGEVTIVFTVMSAEEFAEAACANTLGQSDVADLSVLDGAAAHQALVDFSGHDGLSVGIFVADTEGETWGYLFGQVGSKGPDTSLTVPATR